MTEVLYDRATRQILARGAFPDHDPDDPGVGVAAVTGDALLDQPGQKFLNPDGTVRLVPPPDPTPAELAARQAAAQQLADDKATLRAFQANAAPTAAQVVQAVKAQTRMLRLLALAD